MKRLESQVIATHIAEFGHSLRCCDLMETFLLFHWKMEKKTPLFELICLLLIAFAFCQ